MTTVQFTPEKLEQLKNAYRTAINKKADSFTFEGNEYLVSYAKYLIEYLDAELKTEPPNKARKTRLITAAPEMYELLKQVRKYSAFPEELQKDIAHVLFTIDKT